MTGQNWPRCSVCGRTLVIGVGAVNRLEAAVDARGRSPIDDEWGQKIPVGKGRFVTDWADMAIVVDVFLNAPHQLRANELNDLGEGFWELKGGRLRLPFFGVDCAGTPSSSGSHRKLVLTDAVAAPTSADRSARGTHVFGKDGQRTIRRQIEKARGIRRKDEER